MNVPSQQLEELKKKISLWRKTRTNKDKLPDELWKDAVSACSHIGVGKVAKFLGLDFYQLRDRCQKAEASEAKNGLDLKNHAAMSVVVSKIYPPTIQEHSPTLEFVNPQGVKLKVEGNSEFATQLLQAFFGQMR